MYFLNLPEYHAANDNHYRYRYDADPKTCEGGTPRGFATIVYVYIFVAVVVVIFIVSFAGRTGDLINIVVVVEGGGDGDVGGDGNVGGDG